MSRFIIQIARGDYKKFCNKDKLVFGELFLDTTENVLYVGSKEPDIPYKFELSNVEPIPLHVGRTVLDTPKHDKREISRDLYNEWRDFLEWKRNKIE